MSVKYDVLACLQAREGAVVSGAQLAAQLGVTRNSVWKAVRSLREDGYSIGSSTNAGYQFFSSNDVLSEQSVARYLTGDYAVRVYRQVDSTNLVLKADAAKGKPEGTVAIAEEQTAGRGRLGRSFHSAHKTGLYMSILLRPKFAAEEALSITTIAAVAVAETIEALSGRETQIKWVNDVLIDGKKICGILTEASINFENGGLEYAVLGIGVNVTPPQGGFPPDLQKVATAVYTPGGCPSEIRSKIAAGIIEHFFARYRALPDKGYIADYRRRSFLQGKEVTLTVGNREESGVVTDIDSQARLVVRLQSGEVQAFSAGEANIKKKDKGDNL